MRTIIGLLFCVLLGVMVKAQGIIALLWFPLGFIIALFVTAQIVLPIVLGLPRAIRLVSRGEMRSAVYWRLLVTPFVWLVLIAVIPFLIGFFWPSAVAWLDGNAALNVGTWLGIFAILLSPLSKKSRSDFREDFDKSYGRFYTNVRESSELPAARTTMNIEEAERILDIVGTVLQNQNRYAQIPASALQGYDLYRILTGLKLRIANEYLLLSGRPDFEQQFSEGIKIYDGIPWSIMASVVADDQLGHIAAKRVMSAVDPATMQLDKNLDSIETGSSFGDFCKSLGATDPNYWERVYERIGIEHTSHSPRGNQPVMLNI
jgi:hypothetical protein